MENVTEVMGEVGDWEGVGGILGLGLPDSKLLEIEQQSSSEPDKSHAVGGYWLNTHPDPSWEKLAQVLYNKGEEKAVAMTKKYLPKGMCIS